MKEVEIACTDPTRRGGNLLELAELDNFVPPKTAVTFPAISPRLKLTAMLDQITMIVLNFHEICIFLRALI